MRMRAESTGEGIRAWAGLLLGILIGWDLSGASAALGQVYSYKDRRGVVHFTNAPTDGRFHEVAQMSARVTRLSFTATPRGASRRSGRASYFASRSPFRGVFSARREASPELASMIDETSRRYGVDAALVHAVVRAESAFDHLAVSSAGARGLMQLMPTTASEVGVRDVFHPRDNLEGGVYYLRELLDRFSGNTRLALAAYNAGPGAVDSYGGIPPYDETREYVSRVFRYRQEHLRRQLEARLPKKAVGTSR